MLNPHWFGEITHTPLNKDKPVFIAIGEMSVKNCCIPALINSIRELEKNFDFEVWLIGTGADASLSEALPASIRTFGRLPFDKMFELLEKADFLLPLLDPKNDGHKHYLQGVTSGSRQLILGFSKVPVVHSTFAMVYDFSEEDSILHGDDGLMEAMKRALTMTDNEYVSLQMGLKKLAETVYHESLDNLKTRIDQRKLAVSQ